MKSNKGRLGVLRVGVLCLAFAGRAAPAAVSPSSNVVFPADVGVLNVRDPEFGAKGDGQTDDTKAIQKALTQGLYKHRVVYLPNGVYLVSDTLKWQDPANAGNNVGGWGSFLQLQGQSRAGTVIRLKEGAPGFGDENAPKAVIQTGSGGGDGNKHYTDGEGNEAFENHLRDFTVETGQNAGAIGINYQASNVGAMRHVTITGQGFCGIVLTRRDNGPALLKDVRVEGFQFGIRTSQEIAAFTLEDVALVGQHEAGLWIRDSIVGVRHLSSQNAVPAVEMEGVSLLSLFDSTLIRGQGGAAVVCSGSEPRLYARNLQAQGYSGAISWHDQTEPITLTQWSSDKPLGDGAGALSLALPIRETPDFADTNLNDWAEVTAPSGNDDTSAVQAALDAGKNTVCFRSGTYNIQNTLVVPPGVKRILGVGTSLNATQNTPLFRFSGAKAKDLTIVDRLTVGGKAEVLFDHADARELVLRDILPFSSPIYRNVVGAGPLFIEDVSGAGYSFAPGTQVWARQWNLEGGGQPKAVSDGATIWALGLKHESAETILDNKNGARTELWASLSYTFGADPNRPAYLNTDASLVVQMAGTTYMGPNGFFDLLVRDTQNAQVTELRRSQTPGRGGGATLPLYVALSSAEALKKHDIPASTPINKTNKVPPTFKKRSK